MFWLVVLVLLLIVSIVLLLAYVSVKKKPKKAQVDVEKTESYPDWMPYELRVGPNKVSNRQPVSVAPKLLLGSIGSFALFLVVLVFSSFTTVPANTVGIVTWFGKPKGTVDSGIHFMAPWASVDNFETRTQTLDLKPDTNRFKFQGGGGAGIESTVNWHVNSTDAVDLWKQYNTLDNVQDKLLTPRVKNALVRAFSGYTPEQAVDAKNLVKITQDVTNILREDLKGSGVQVNDGDINLKNFELDPSVQDRINSIVKANADLERAKVTKQQASVDAATNKIRQQSLTSQALINQCLTTVNNWDEKKNGPLPATFNCGLGSGSSSVLVQGK